MKANIYDFILTSYSSNDTLQPVIMTAGLIDDMAYSTDAYACIRFDRELANKDYTNPDFPNAKAIYDNLKLDIKHKVNVDELLLNLFNCELCFETKSELCEKCVGQGKHECKCCDNYNDCNDCDGTGRNEIDKPYAKLEVIGSDLKIFGKTLAPKLLYRALNTAMLLKEKTMILQYSEKRNELVFQVGKCEILIMTKSSRLVE